MRSILIEHYKKNYKLVQTLLRVSQKHKNKIKKHAFHAGITNTYPSCTGPALVCRAMESSLINALVMDSVELRPPSCYKRGISKYPPSLICPQLCFAKSPPLALCISFLRIFLFKRKLKISHSRPLLFYTNSQRFYPEDYISDINVLKNV